MSDSPKTTTDQPKMITLYRAGREDANAVYTAEVPEGAECIQVWARPKNRDKPPIVMVDYERMVYLRAGSKDEQPFPALWYSDDMLEWNLKT